MYRIIPFLIIIISGFILGSGGWLKQPFNENDRVLEAIQQLDEAIQQGKWEHAEERIEYAEKGWHHVINRIQYSVERQVIYELGILISRLKGNVAAKDDKEAKANIEEFYMLWAELGK